jgi:hypothetical protein
MQPQDPARAEVRKKPCPHGCGHASIHQSNINIHALSCPKNPANAGKVATARQVRGEKHDAAGGLVASEASKKRLHATCADADDFVKACDHDALSELTTELWMNQGLRGDEEARDIERQAANGLEFFRVNSLPCQDILVIIQAVAQIFDDLEQEAATNSAVLLLAQTAVLDANSDGKDEMAAAQRLTKIVEAKGTENN